ncbi:MAG: hypothetical protein JST54_16200 [Deltaproteobacteria bacterium]|nr:hypothetical protein [Deltaproteobacteria bacterium]
MRAARVAALTALLTGCGGGFDCTESSSCAADPPASATQITACKNALADSKCGSTYERFAQCFHDQAACAPDGTTDTKTTSSTCASQLEAYTACTQG